MTPKEQALRAIQSLPYDCSWNDIEKQIGERALLPPHREHGLPLQVREPAPALAGKRPAPGPGRGRRMSRTYDVVMERDEEGWFVASVPGLRGCHSQGNTLSEALGRVREAIELCLEVGSAEGGEYLGIVQVTVPG